MLFATHFTPFKLLVAGFNDTMLKIVFDMVPHLGYNFGIKNGFEERHSKIHKR